MHAGPAELLVADRLANSGLHEGGPCEVKTAPLRHEQLVAQDGKVAAPRDAVSHDGGQLWHTRRGDDRVVTEDAAEVVLIGEHFILKRQENTGGIDQVGQWEPVL